MQILSLLSTQFPSVTPACFRPLSSKSVFVLALQMGSRMSSSCSSFYSTYIVCFAGKARGQLHTLNISQHGHPYFFMIFPLSFDVFFSPYNLFWWLPCLIIFPAWLLYYKVSHHKPMQPNRLSIITYQTYKYNMDFNVNFCFLLKRMNALGVCIRTI